MFCVFEKMRRRPASRPRSRSSGRSACGRCTWYVVGLRHDVRRRGEGLVDVAGVDGDARRHLARRCRARASACRCCRPRRASARRPISPSAAPPPGSRRTPAARRRRGSSRCARSATSGMCLIELSSTETTCAPSRRRMRPARAAARRRPCSMPGTRMFWTYVYVPVTLAGMSMRGGLGAMPTSLYWRPASSGARRGPAGEHDRRRWQHLGRHVPWIDRAGERSFARSTRGGSTGPGCTRPSRR